MVEEEDDVVCTVCFNGEVQDNNEIVLCDKCDTAVHQLCYSVDRWVLATHITVHQ